MGFITFAHTDIMYFQYSHSTTLSFPVFFLLKLSPLYFHVFLLFVFFLLVRLFWWPIEFHLGCLQEFR